MCTVFFALGLLALVGSHQAQASCVPTVGPPNSEVLCSGPNSTTGFFSFPGTTVDYTFTSNFVGTNFGFGNNSSGTSAITATFQPGATVTDPGMSGFRGGNVSSFTGDLSAGAAFGSFNIQSNATVNINVGGTSDYIFANVSKPDSLITVSGTVNHVSPPELGRFATITLREGTVDVKQGGTVNVANFSTTAIFLNGGNTGRAVTNAGLVNGDIFLQGSGVSTVINTGTITGGVELGGNANKSVVNAGVLGGASLGGGGTKRVELHPTGTFTSFVFGGGGDFVLGGPGEGTFNLSEMSSTFDPGLKYFDFGTLAKEGTSTWTVTGTSADPLPWTIKEGTLFVAAGADLGTGNVTVEGGTLKGFGTVGGLFNVGGTVRPGGSTGTLHMASFSQGPDGLLAIELSPTQTSVLDVAGSASLAGELLVLPQPGGYQPGSVFTFLTAPGGVTGTFDPVVDDLAALIFTAIYGTNSASLVFAGYDFSQFAETPNQKSVAKAIDQGAGNEDFNALLYELAALPPQDIAQGLSQLGSKVATVFPGVTQDDRRALMASFIDRLGPSCLEKGKRYAADPTSLDPTVWARGFYRNSDISETGGGTVGLEAHPDRRTCAGLGFNYANTDLALDDLPQSGEVQAYSLGAYARRDWSLLFADGAAAATYASIDSTRHILFAGETARGDTDATGAGLILGVGVVLQSGSFVFEPRIGLDYDHNNQDSFSERGSTAALRVAGDERDALRSNLGARLHAIWNFASGGALMPELSVAWAHDLLDPAVALRQSFLAAQNAAFVIRGEDPPEDVFLLGAGLSYHPNASDELFIRYDGAWAEDDEHGNAISAGGKIRW